MVVVHTPHATFRIDYEPVEKLWQRAPEVAFEELRDAVGGIFGSHRREWLARKQVKFAGRGGMFATPVKAGGASGGPSRFRAFFYAVHPAQKKPGSAAEAGLERIWGEAYTESKAALGLEQGGTETAKGGQWLALPIGVTLDSLGRPKPKWRTPTKYRKTGKELVAFPHRPGGPIVLHQVKGGKKAASREGAFTPLGLEKGQRRKSYLPAYVLVRKVTRQPRLEYMDTWKGLGSDRERRIARAAERIIARLG